MNKITNFFSSIGKALYGTVGDSFSTFFYGAIGQKSHYELLKEYKNLVYTCITTIALEVGAYQPVFKVKGRKPGTYEVKENHPFLDVIERPNPDLSQFQMFETLMSYYKLTGEWFLYVAVGETTRKPKELYPMRPDRVEIVVKDGGIQGYIYKRLDGTEIPLDRDEVIHHKTFNPLNEYRGLGTVQAILLYIDVENDTSLFQRNFMRNQATPSGVLTLKNKMSTEGWKKLKKQWRERQSGLGNAGKTLMIRESEASFTKLGMSLADINLGDVKRYTKQDVLDGFKVPKALLGQTDSTGLGRNNIEAIEYIFARWTIDPELIKMDDTFRRAADTYYPGQQNRVEHVSQIPENKDFKLEERKASVDVWKTRNEIRLEEGLAVVEGGDNLYSGFNQVAIDEADSPATEGTKSVPSIKIIRKAHEHKHKAVRKDAANDKFFRLLERYESKAGNRYSKNLKKFLDGQEKEIRRIVASNFTKKQLKTKDTVEYDGSAFTLTFTKEEVELNFLDVLLAALLNSGESAVELIGLPDINFVIQQATRDAILDSTTRLTTSFNKQTAQKIQKQLAAGLANQESVEELQARVKLVFDDARDYRSKRIAKTEAHKAVNHGVADGYLQSGVKKMRWTVDTDPCEFCRAMDGAIIDIGKPFIPKGGSITGADGGEYIADYDDVKYADLHPEDNCKLLPVI